MIKNFSRWSDEFGEELDDIELLDEDVKYIVVQTVIAQSSGICCLDKSHRIKRGDIIGKLQYSDNPLIPLSGWACRHCTVTYS